MVWPLLRGRSPTRSVAPKRQGGSGVLSLRLFGLSGAWVPKNLARRNLGLLVSAGAMLLEAIGPAGRSGGELDLSVLGPFNLPLFSPLRARGRRAWSGRCYGVARPRDGRAKTAGAPYLFQPYARARARRGLAVVTGSLAHAIGRAKTAGGLGRASLRLFGLLYPWRVGAEEFGAAKFRFIGFGRRDAARGDRAGWAVQRWRVMIYRFWAHALTSSISLTRARGPDRGLAVVTGSLANAIGRAKTAWGARACFLSGFRARSRYPLGAWVPKNLARRNLGLLVSTGAMLLEAIGPAGPVGRSPASCRFIGFGPTPALTSFSALRAREGEAVVWPLLRGRSPTQIGRAKTAGGLGRAFSPAFRARLALARGCRRIWRGEFRFIGFARRDAARGDRAGWAVSGGEF